MVELKNLCESCDMEVVGQITQNLDSINKASYVGSGKIEEIRMMKDSLEADTIVCNDELSPAQIENLEDVLKDVRVIDRTYVILEIFDKRAKTKEAKLQVEIASLKYYLPRLKGLHSGMSRQGGGRNKGKGETKLELDRRKIEQRISLLNSQLKDLTKNRQQSREQRKKNNMINKKIISLQPDKGNLFQSKIKIILRKKQSNEYEIELIDKVNLPNGKNIEFLKEANLNTNFYCRLSSDEVKLPLHVRSRRDGDKMTVKGMIGSKKINDIFIDSKISMKERETWPVVVDSLENIVWLPGLKKSKFDKPKGEKCDIILKYY